MEVVPKAREGRVGLSQACGGIVGAEQIIDDKIRG